MSHNLGASVRMYFVFATTAVATDARCFIVTIIVKYQEKMEHYRL